MRLNLGPKIRSAVAHSEAHFAQIDLSTCARQNKQARPVLLMLDSRKNSTPNSKISTINTQARTHVRTRAQLPENARSSATKFHFRHRIAVTVPQTVAASLAVARPQWSIDLADMFVAKICLQRSIPLSVWVVSLRWPLTNRRHGRTPYNLRSPSRSCSTRFAVARSLGPNYV